MNARKHHGASREIRDSQSVDAKVAPKVLGLVPARGGSKGIPHKNIRKLAGTPLVAHAAQAALAAERLSKVLLSTDDEDIAEVGAAAGLEVPFLRPKELAQDDTPTLPVVLHALEFFAARDEHFDAVCLLQPTDPFRRAQDIDACVTMLFDEHADTVLSVLSVPAHYNPHWVYKRHDDGALYLATGESEPIPRRQSLPPAFHRSGSVYVTRTQTLLKKGSLFGARVLGYEMDAARTINLDTEDDWALAERMMQEEREEPSRSTP